MSVRPGGFYSASGGDGGTPPAGGGRSAVGSFLSDQKGTKESPGVKLGSTLDAKDASSLTKFYPRTPYNLRGRQQECLRLYPALR